MGRDGICRVQDKFYSKTIRFYDINYQLAQNEDKNAIFENWCDFLNYFDSTIHFQLSFINQHSNMAEYEKVIHINPQEDEFDDLRMEFAQMLNNQLAKGNNGLMRTKYITFGIEAENIREARPKLERIESDIMNNFKILGVTAYPLNGAERLQIMYETFNQDSKVPFHFSYDEVLRTGLSTKDYICLLYTSINILQTLVVAIGAGLAVWGVINLLEGYGNDNPGAKSQGIKQLMAGGGVVLIGTQLVPLLSGLFS